MNLTSLRPKDRTAASISEALALAKGMRSTALEGVEQAKATRDGLLLDGDAKQLAVAEKTLIEARGDDERVEAIVAELSSRLTATIKAEALADVRAAVEAVRDATITRLNWWTENGADFLAMLKDSTEMHRARANAVRRAKEVSMDLLRQYEGGSELVQNIYDDVPSAEDVDDATWRLLEKLSEAYQWADEVHVTEEAA